MTGEMGVCPACKRRGEVAVQEVVKMQYHPVEWVRAFLECCAYE